MQMMSEKLTYTQQVTTINNDVRDTFK